MPQSLAEFLGTLPDKQEEPCPPEVWLPEKKSAKAFSRALLESPEYRNSLRTRIVMGELPPAVECKLWDYAYGKPVERVEVEDKTPRFESLSAEQLEERAMYLAQLARQMRANSDDEDAAVH